MPVETADSPAVDPVRQRFENALASLAAKTQQDPYVLALVLLGSLSYDQVWDKSDIDVMLVTQETRQKQGSLSLVEDGVNIHAIIVPRSEFKKMMEGSVQSSFTHSMLIKGRIVYTRDDTLEELWDNRQHFGARDREISLLRNATLVLWSFAKAQKWLRVKRDPHYSAFWIMKSLDNLASIETVLNGEITGREVLWQALKYNPAFFHAVYTDLLDAPKTEATVGAALERIDAYLKEHAPVVFRPVFDYLAESGAPRAVRDINHYFGTHLGVSFADGACEWLADEGYIEKVATPARITEKSRVDVEEAAYYYDPSA